MKMLVWIAGLCFLFGSGVPASAQSSAAPQGDPRAMALMEEAARTRYTWGLEVSAVSGKFTWNIDGKSGAAKFHDLLHKPGGLTFTAESGAELPDDVKDHAARC